MDIVHSVARMREASRAREGRIGFVPTMGALHEGHLSLVREARAVSEAVVLSVFVNPAQFGRGEDYEKYPRTLARDAELAAAAGVDVLFAPEAAEMYPAGPATIVEVTGLSDVWCGASRPGHFRGVATVVLKLLEIVRPRVAVFGRKDYQQALIVQRLVADLHVGVEIIVAPIVREPDGLALSSRNAYLSPAERAAALVLRRTLDETERLWKSGERDGEAIENAMKHTLAGEPLARVDYVAAADPATLEPIGRGKAVRAVAALGVWIGKTRLIDNTLLG